MSEPEQTVPLDTEEQIGQAGSYVLTLCYDFEQGRALTPEEQRQVLTIAYSALLRVKPLTTARWTDTSAGPVPAWLQGEIDRRESAEEQQTARLYRPKGQP